MSAIEALPARTADYGALKEKLPQMNLSARQIQQILTLHHSRLRRPKKIEINGNQCLTFPCGFGAPQKGFFEAGGILDPSPAQRLYAVHTKENPPMICYKRSYEEMEYSIEGKTYKGFELWKKVYEAFPEYAVLTEAQAREAGIYPNIYYYTRTGREWMAKFHRGHLADLEYLAKDTSLQAEALLEQIKMCQPMLGCCSGGKVTDLDWIYIDGSPHPEEKPKKVSYKLGSDGGLVEKDEPEVPDYSILGIRRDGGEMYKINHYIDHFTALAALPTAIVQLNSTPSPKGTE